MATAKTLAFYGLKADDIVELRGGLPDDEEKEEEEKKEKEAGSGGGGSEEAQQSFLPPKGSLMIRSFNKSPRGRPTSPWLPVGPSRSP